METSSFIKRFQGTEVVAIYYFCDGDESTSVDIMDVNEISDAIRSYNRETVRVWGKRDPDLLRHLVPLKNIQDKDDLLRLLNTTIMEDSSVIPKAEWDQKISEAKRVEIEDLATNICRRYNCKVDSIDFMKALQAERERLSEYRTGLEEDGICSTGHGIYSPSVATAEWGDEFRDCMEGVSKIEAWIESNLPLLWAKWRSLDLENSI